MIPARSEGPAWAAQSLCPRSPIGPHVWTMTDSPSPPRHALVLDAAAITALPDTPLGYLAGVRRRVLWVSNTSEAGVLEVSAGHRLGLHAHRSNQHHLWVLAGTARIVGHDLSAGGYVHVPAGVEHDIDATGTDGCSVYYLYLREGA